tara:strand:+ start:429 stop:758 length:330 start_codon:yes stop_codon:yes gene_type:complete
MKKEKIPFHEKFNAVELYIWRNKKHFGTLLDHLMARPYGSRNSKWRYDYQTEEFVWNQFRQVDKYEWSKEPEVKRMKAERLLGGKRNEYNPMWIEFQEAVKQVKERAND